MDVGVLGQGKFHHGVFLFFAEEQADEPKPIPQTVSGQLVPNSIRQTPSGKSPFTLSWSHYVVLMTIKDPDERSFYEIESRQADWDVRELKRQKAACLYERLALSRDKEGIRKLAKEVVMYRRQRWPEDWHGK